MSILLHKLLFSQMISHIYKIRTNQTRRLIATSKDLDVCSNRITSPCPKHEESVSTKMSSKRETDEIIQVFALIDSLTSLGK